jgi:hypothetical protein
MAAALGEKGPEYSIKPEKVTPQLDASQWPLLLKNYDKRAYSESLYLHCADFG